MSGLWPSQTISCQSENETLNPKPTGPRVQFVAFVFHLVSCVLRPDNVCRICNLLCHIWVWWLSFHWHIHTHTHTQTCPCLVIYLDIPAHTHTHTHTLTHHASSLSNSYCRLPFPSLFFSFPTRVICTCLTRNDVT